MSKKWFTALALALLVLSAPAFAAGREAPRRDPGRERPSLGQFVKVVRTFIVRVLSFEPTVPIP